jgi:hypothetical protein
LRQRPGKMTTAVVITIETAMHTPVNAGRDDAPDFPTSGPRGRAPSRQFSPSRAPELSPAHGARPSTSPSSLGVPHRVPAHLEDRAAEALDTEPRMLPNARRCAGGSLSAVSSLRQLPLGPQVLQEQVAHRILSSHQALERHATGQTISRRGPFAVGSPAAAVRCPARGGASRTPQRPWRRGPEPGALSLGRRWRQRLSSDRTRPVSAVMVSSSSEVRCLFRRSNATTAVTASLNL